MINARLLFLQTIGHFFVDAVCAFTVVEKTQDLKQAFFLFLLYNFLAFCLQPLTGLILDKSTKIFPKHYIILSFVLLLCGLLMNAPIVTTIVFVGIGNCLFHVGAGTLILTTSQKKMAPLGVFVSSGALGLFLGGLSASNSICYHLLIISLLILLFFNINLHPNLLTKKQNNNHFLITALLCICIAIRSFMGFLPLSQFEKTPLVLLMITVGVLLGKSLGGFLCDRWGIRRVVLYSTSFVLLLFLFSFQSPFLWTLVQIIINVSMPITLYLMYRSLPSYPAFSFGLAASLLVIGWLSTLGLRQLSINPACFLILFMVNLIVILYAERRLK